MALRSTIAPAAGRVIIISTPFSSWTPAQAGNFFNANGGKRDWVAPEPARSP